jgi:hypothetical protein
MVEIEVSDAAFAALLRTLPPDQMIAPSKRTPKHG